MLPEMEQVHILVTRNIDKLGLGYAKPEIPLKLDSVLQSCTGYPTEICVLSPRGQAREIKRTNTI